MHPCRWQKVPIAVGKYNVYVSCLNIPYHHCVHARSAVAWGATYNAWGYQFESCSYAHDWFLFLHEFTCTYRYIHCPSQYILVLNFPIMKQESMYSILTCICMVERCYGTRFCHIVQDPQNTPYFRYIPGIYCLVHLVTILRNLAFWRLEW